MSESEKKELLDWLIELSDYVEVPVCELVQCYIEQREDI